MQCSVLLRVTLKNNGVGIATRVVGCQDIANLPERDIMELHTRVVELEQTVLVEKTYILLRQLFFFW